MRDSSDHLRRGQGGWQHSTRRRFLRLRWIFLAVFALGCGSAEAALKADETLHIYPALGSRVEGGWDVRMDGIVYEAGNHPGQAALIRKLLGIDADELTADQRKIYRQRIELFLVDNERGKRLRAELGGRTLRFGRSGPNGHFGGRFALNDREAAAAGLSGSETVTNLPVRVSMPGGAVRVVTVPVHLMARTGVSVISDLDDTIKISNVRDKRALIESTFCKPFEPVPGMAALYQKWGGEGARFHYVSASPWQLYPALSAFVASNGFPAGTFHLKNLRLKDASVLQLFGAQTQYKLGTIRDLLERCPERRFVLVGDSGEQDPEIYGELARRHPKQVRRVFIRNVTREEAGAPRYREAFRDLPPEGWTIFTDPAELPDWVILPELAPSGP